MTMADIPATNAAPEAPSSTVITVPVVKSKSTVDIDTAAVPNDIYEHAVREGFKVIVNGGAHKITPANIPNEADRLKEAQALAEQRVQDMYDGKLKLRAAKAAAKSDGKYDAKTITEARRIARDMVKKAIKAKGQKISGYTASEITQLANGMIADGVPGADAIFAQAEKNLAVRNNDVAVSIDTINLKSDAAVAEAAKKVGDKKKAASGLSAKQAGMTAHRATAH